MQDNLKFSVTDPTWTADEDLKLLTALEMTGIGNWEVVSAKVSLVQAQHSDLQLLDPALTVVFLPC